MNLRVAFLCVLSLRLVDTVAANRHGVAIGEPQLVAGDPLVTAEATLADGAGDPRVAAKKSPCAMKEAWRADKAPQPINWARRAVTSARRSRHSSLEKICGPAWMSRGIM